MSYSGDCGGLRYTFGSRRGGSGRRWGLKSIIKQISADNSGLKVVQRFDYANIEVDTTGRLQFTTLTSTLPSSFVLNNILISGSNSKVYLKSSHTHGRYFNNSNIPLHFKMVYSVCRRDLNEDVIGNLLNVFQQGAPSMINLGTGDPLTSHMAQKYFEWLDVKNCILEGGKMLTIDLHQPHEDFISGDYEGNTEFLMTKGFHVVFIFIDGPPISNIEGTQTSSGPISVQFTHCHQYKYRLIQDNTSTSVISQGLNPVIFYGDIVMPTVQVQPPQIA